MFPRGHAGISLMINIPFLILFSNTFPINIICTILIMWLSIIPDIDISSKLFLDKIKHRGITHTIEFIILFSIIFNIFIIFMLNIFSILYLYNMYILLVPLIGLLSHTFTDILDIHGVRVSYIFSEKVTKIKFIQNNANSILNNMIFISGVLLTFSIIFTTI